MTQNIDSASRISNRFWLLSAFLALVFLTGGASRVDVQSLTVLRPVSVLLCGFALMSLRRDHIVGRGWLLGLFGCVAVLTLLHVIPLSVDPLSLRVIADEYGNTVQSAALQMSWGTLSVTPVKAWQSLATLATPGAVLLIAMQLKRSDLYRVLPLLVGLGALSGFIGLLQVVGNAESPFYLYRITNDYTAVGLFANRNHAALMLALLFPMLAVLASQDSGTVNDQNRRMLMAATIGIVLVPLILVTGSRSGLLVSLVGIGGAALLYQRRVRVSNLRSERVWKRSRAVPVLGALALVCLAFLTIFFSRAEAIERLFADESDMYGRGDFWVVSIDLFLRNLPWGSGAGSFAEMYQVAEPSRMLGSAFLNRAHNDWIETALTFGLPGLLIMTTGMVLYLLQTFRIWHKMDGKRQSVILARLSSIMIAMMALASVSDYPLRTPAMLCVLVVSLLWLIEPRKITV